MSSMIEPRPRDAGREHRLCLTGELDVATGPAAFLLIIEAEPEQGDTVELDLGGVTFIDSSGVAMLMKAKSYLEAAGCRMVLSNLSASIFRLLDVLGITEMFSIEGEPSRPPTS